MVNHQRQSHQKKTSSTIDCDETSESDSDGSLSDPQYSGQMMHSENVPQHSTRPDRRSVYSSPYFGRYQDIIQSVPSCALPPNNSHLALQSDVTPTQGHPYQFFPENVHSSPNSYSSISRATPVTYTRSPIQDTAHTLQYQQLSLAEQQQFMAYQGKMPQALQAHANQFQGWCNCRCNDATSHNYYSLPYEWQPKLETYCSLLGARIGPCN